jgi:replicative DNA helicase
MASNFHNDVAEKALIGCIMDDPKILSSISSVLDRGIEDLYLLNSKIIYAAILEISDAGDPVEFLSIQAHLSSQDKIVFGLNQPIGNQIHMESLTGILTGYYKTDNWEYYARLIKIEAAKRATADFCAKINSQLNSWTPDNFQDKADELTDGLFQLSDVSLGTLKTVFKIGDLAVEAYDAAVAASDRFTETGSIISGVTTGFTALDYLTGGFQPEESILVAARPSLGKTTLAVNIAENASAAGTPVLIFSLEMSAQQLAIRCMSSGASVDSAAIKRGTTNSDEFERMAKYVGKVQTGNAPMYIDATPDISLQTLRARARRYQKEFGIKLIVIDYLQLLSDDRYRGNRVLELGSIAQGIKNLARRLKIPIISVAQVNRGVEDRKDKRPQLGDIRESGAIEQAADICCFLYRDSYYEPKEEVGTSGLSVLPAEIIVAKNRNNATGTIKVGWEKEKNRFINYTSSNMVPPVETQQEGYIPDGW